MIFLRIAEAIGVMVLFYILSQISYIFAKKLDHFRKLRFLVYFLLFIHYFATIGSLFIGLFMFYKEQNTQSLKQSIAELNTTNLDYIAKIEALKQENEYLNDQLCHAKLCNNKQSFESCQKSGYIQGYVVGFEDCMEVTNVTEDIRSLKEMCRRSASHRYKTRPFFLKDVKPIRDGCILK